MITKKATEKRLTELSAKLPVITAKQHQTGFEKCFDKLFVQSRKTAFCLECGHDWKLSDTKPVEKLKCDKCGTKLEATNSYSNGLTHTDYYSVVTTSQEFQVVRVMCIKKYMKKGEKAIFFGHEVMQHWIDSDFNVKTFSKATMGLSMYFDLWIVNSKLTLKSKDFINNPKYFLNASYTHPTKKLLPVFTRNGFKGNFHHIAPHLFLIGICTDSKAETLLKTNQISLFQYHLRQRDFKKLDSYWSSIKICIRNGYTVTDAKDWIDYLDLLNYFGKDLESPKYICPADLKEAHDRYVIKKRDADRKGKKMYLKSTIKKEQRLYFKAKSKYFDLEFKKGNIVVRVIQTVDEFLTEGDAFNHCIFTNEYFKKKESLVFSAEVNGKKTETVEVSLVTKEVVQSRGMGNKATKFHKQIVELVNSNIYKISA